MLHINRRHALAGLAATAVSGRAMAQPSTFTTNMYGGRWENTWREKVLPPFAKTIGRSVTLDIGLGARWVSNFRAAGKDNPPFSAVMLNERYTAMLRDDGFFEPLTPALVPNLADVVPSAILKDSTAVTGMLAPLVIAYRTDLVKKPPRGWADLWRPDLRGQLGLYTITNSAARHAGAVGGRAFRQGPDRHRHRGQEIRRAEAVPADRLLGPADAAADAGPDRRGADRYRRDRAAEAARPAARLRRARGRHDGVRPVVQRAWRAAPTRRRPPSTSTMC